MRAAAALMCLVAVLLVLAAPAAASEIVDRNVKSPTLRVDAQNRAMVSYTDAKGKHRDVLFWNAVNAIPPTKGKKQIAFRKDYAGGYGAFRKNLSKIRFCGWIIFWPNSIAPINILNQTLIVNSLFNC